MTYYRLSPPGDDDRLASLPVVFSSGGDMLVKPLQPFSPSFSGLVQPQPSKMAGRAIARFGVRGWRWPLSALASLALGMVPLSAQAAETVTVRLGPLQPSVAIADLEQFAETGRVPSGLQFYRPLLTQGFREALSSRLQLDPNTGDKLVTDLLHSSAGERFLNTLQVAMPDTDANQLQKALAQAAKQPDGMSLVSFLRAFPGKSITIDGMSALVLASQLNFPYWQSQTMSTLLDRELTVPAKPPQTQFDPTQPGPYWVWKQTMVLKDYPRDRTIPIDLYWSRRTHGPLVVLSHGFGADRRFLGYLAYHLASYGLSVVAIEHPGSNVAWLTGTSLESLNAGQTSNTILPASEFIDRPRDVSFVLDRLHRLDQYSSTLQGKFNTDEVTVIGHSLGGYTALALAGAQLNLKHLRQFCDDPQPVALSPADLLQCNAADLPDALPNVGDRRVVQTIVLNPVIGRLFDQASLAQVKIPTLMLAGTDDAITPAVSQQFLPFSKLKDTKYLLTAIGGTHLSVGDPTNLNRALTGSIFVRERSETDTAPLRQLLRGISLAFVQQLTPESRRYAPFLTSAYVQSFSTANLKLRLNRDLPPNLTQSLKMTALPMEQLMASTLAKQQAAAQELNICKTDLSCLMSSLPLVMFILQGGLPLSAVQFLHLKDAERRQRAKGARKRSSNGPSDEP